MCKKSFYLTDGLLFFSTALFIGGYYNVANIIVILGLLFYLSVEYLPNKHSRIYNVFYLAVLLIFVVMIFLIMKENPSVNNQYFNYKIIHKSIWLGLIVLQFSNVSKLKRTNTSSVYCTIVILLMIVQFVGMTWFYYIYEYN